MIQVCKRQGELIGLFCTCGFVLLSMWGHREGHATCGVSNTLDALNLTLENVLDYVKPVLAVFLHEITLNFLRNILTTEAQYNIYGCGIL